MDFLVLFGTCAFLTTLVPVAHFVDGLSFFSEDLKFTLKILVFFVIVVTALKAATGL